VTDGAKVSARYQMVALRAAVSQKGTSKMG